MRLYVVRHGDAVSEKVDPARPLSEEGCGTVQSIASFLKESGVRVSRVFHSGKARAAQTAAILAESVAGAAKLEEIEMRVHAMKKEGKDTFDIELEIKLAKDKLKQGRFRMAKIYIESLEKYFK